MPIDIHQTGPNTSGKWLCTKCKTHNDPQVTRCSWCSAVKPATDAVQHQANEREARLTQLIHQSIEKMSYPQKVKAYRLLEDNVI